MSTIVLTSASGAPGVTTTALGLALSWPVPSLLVDADRAASQAVLAGYLQGQAATAGLEAILQAHRERTQLAPAIALAERPLPAGASHPDGSLARTFLPGFTHLGAIDVFDQVWAPLLAEFEASDRGVIIDAGRADHHGLPDALVRDADLVALVCRTSLIALAGARLHLATLLETGPLDAVGLILIGPGRPYSSAEVAAQFGVPVLAEISWDPAAANDLHRGHAALDKRWGKRPLATSLIKAAEQLHARTRRHELPASDQDTTLVAP